MPVILITLIASSLLRPHKTPMSMVPHYHRPSSSSLPDGPTTDQSLGLATLVVVLRTRPSAVSQSRYSENHCLSHARSTGSRIIGVRKQAHRHDSLFCIVFFVLNFISLTNLDHFPLPCVICSSLSLMSFHQGVRGISILESLHSPETTISFLGRVFSSRHLVHLLAPFRLSALVCFWSSHLSVIHNFPSPRQVPSQPLFSIEVLKRSLPVILISLYLFSSFRTQDCHSLYC